MSDHANKCPICMDSKWPRSRPGSDICIACIDENDPSPCKCGSTANLRKLNGKWKCRQCAERECQRPRHIMIYDVGMPVVDGIPIQEEDRII